jgi:hypothetical protein
VINKGTGKLKAASSSSSPSPILALRSKYWQETATDGAVRNQNRNLHTIATKMALQVRPEMHKSLAAAAASAVLKRETKLASLQ